MAFWAQAVGLVAPTEQDKLWGQPWNESLFFLPYQDWQRDRPSLPHQGSEEGCVLTTAEPVQPPPQEQPQRKAVSDGSSPGSRKTAFPFLSSPGSLLFFSHPPLLIPTFLFGSHPREVIWGDGFVCLCVDTSQQQFSPISLEQTAITGPLVMVSGSLMLT